MKSCKECGGACCKYLSFIFDGGPLDEEFYKERGIVVYDGWVFVPHECPHLKMGACEIYEARPYLCKSFRVDGNLCKLCYAISKAKGD